VIFHIETRYMVLIRRQTFAKQDINEFDIAVSLPCNLKGYVKITEISDTYLKRLEKEIVRQQTGVDDDSTPPIAGLSDFFYVGQYVRCMIIRLDEATDGKRIELSMRETLLNRRSPLSTLRPGQIVSGSIASSEDHGYVVSLGIKGANGFLLKKNAVGRVPSSVGASEAPLVEGQPVDLLITSVNQVTKTIYVDASYEKISSTMVRSFHIS
jgi:rRNA biogenesis protein RRP5